jgi:Tfp pilus assembly protein PilX
MHTDKHISIKEDGFILVAGMMILLILTLIGIAATTTTVYELQISGNDTVAKQVFYDAESAAYEGAQRLENETDTDNLKAARSRHHWLFMMSEKNSLVTDKTQWNNNKLLSGMSTTDSSVKIAAFDGGVVKGDKAGSLKMTSSSVFEYKLLGYSEIGTGRKMIEIGYKKRY